MMEFQKLIEVRRSIRKYATDKKVTKEELMEMIGAAQEAPSWKNTETGRYYCVLSEEMTERVRRECLPEGNARKAENAVLVVTTFVKDKAGFQNDKTADNELGNGWGCYDLGLQNENFVLKAAELGYGTLIMGLRDGEQLRKVLDIPEEETVVAVIAVGVAAEEPKRPRRKGLDEIQVLHPKCCFIMSYSFCIRLCCLFFFLTGNCKQMTFDQYRTYCIVDHCYQDHRNNCIE